MQKTHLGRICILGAGKTGQDLARYCSCISERTDAIDVYAGSCDVSQKTADFFSSLEHVKLIACDCVTEDYDIAIASPGISEFSDFFLSAKQHAREIMGEPEFAWRENPSHWIGVTGTNGKTTTVSLIGALLGASGIDTCVAGNIGQSTISVTPSRAKDNYLVAELSSYQLATTTQFHPHIACLLNISQDHLTWHKSYENYVTAKMRMFNNLDADDFALIGIDSKESKILFSHVQANSQARVIAISSTTMPDMAWAAGVIDNALCVRLDNKLYTCVSINKLALKGKHNVQNALCALAVALLAGADVDTCAEVLSRFSSLPHRMEACGIYHHMHFINDSKATNVQASAAALSVYKHKTCILLLGGSDKGINYTPLAQDICRSCTYVICYGQAKEHIYEDLKALLHDVTLTQAAHLQDAFVCAVNFAQEHIDTPCDILLAPACSSFDEFASFEERGDVFKKLVSQYIASQTR